MRAGGATYPPVRVKFAGTNAARRLRLLVSPRVSSLPPYSHAPAPEAQQHRLRAKTHIFPHPSTNRRHTSLGASSVAVSALNFFHSDQNHPLINAPCRLSHLSMASGSVYVPAASRASHSGTNPNIIPSTSAVGCTHAVPGFDRLCPAPFCAVIAPLLHQR